MNEYLAALRNAVHYNPTRGTFSYSPKGKVYKDHIGQTKSQKYPLIAVLGGHFPAHRLAWFLHYGEWPEMLDHINGNKFDNRIDNLRRCCKATNARNARRPSGTKSKYRGVTMMGKDWIAQIRCNNKQRRLGRFRSEVEAAKAYDAAARELHKEFAVLNFP